MSGLQGHRGSRPVLCSAGSSIVTQEGEIETSNGDCVVLWDAESHRPLGTDQRTASMILTVEAVGSFETFVYCHITYYYSHLRSRRRENLRSHQVFE